MTTAANDENRAYRVQIDISADRNTHEAYVITEALAEYAAAQRCLGLGDNGESLNELADVADRLRERIDAQIADEAEVAVGDRVRARAMHRRHLGTSGGTVIGAGPVMLNVRFDSGRTVAVCRYEVEPIRA